MGKTLKEKKQVLLIGHYGRGNIGDEMMLRGIRRLMPGEVHLMVLGGEREKKLRQLFSGLRKSEWLWLGGGSMFHDLPKPVSRKYRSLLKMCMLTLLGKLFRLKVAWIGVGVGPLHTPLAKKMARFCLKQSSFRSVRDVESKNWIKENGFESKLTPDLALTGFQPKSIEPQPSSFVLGVNIFPYHAIYHAEPDMDREWMDFLAATLKSLSESGNVTLKLLSFSNKLTENDQNALDYLAEKLGISLIFQPEQSIEAIQTCDGVLSMRYHASLVSAYLGKATIALAYHPKCMVLDQALGLNQRSLMAWPAADTYELLKRHIHSMIEHPDAYRAVFQKAELQKQLEENALPDLKGWER
ncbi:MAG: hypothetical protein CR997_12830 [Acidobacteria bacterium]|nr:MAG: hypothetical protein CR997_12830 [Acidobacteriota bacterium]